MKLDNTKCYFFAKCGGCDFLDLSDDDYQKLKKEILTKELSYLFEKDIKLQDKINYNFIAAKSRRRITLQIDSQNHLGFFAKKSRSLVEIDSCYIADKKISALINALKKFIKSQASNLFTQISITLFDNGLDLILQVKKDLDFLQIQKIISFAKEHDLNISYKIKNHITPIYLPRKNQIFYTKSFLSPRLHDGVQTVLQEKNGCRHEAGMTDGIDDFKIDLSGEVFIQATKQGLESIVGFIRDFLNKNKNLKKAADIYAGFGAYSFAICDLVSVSSFEGSEEMVNLISKNAISNSLTHKIKAVQRDLFQDAISKNELENFDVIIINPPRNGATPQVKEITKSKVKNVIYVSCNPKTFAFDANILIDSGFRIESLLVIDQFYGSKHLELAAILTK